MSLMRGYDYADEWGDIVKTLDDFIGLMNYYKGQAEDGKYHNPYDVENELLDILRPLRFDMIDERIKYEDMAHDTGMLFWDM
jgi:hypothetical protein